MFGHIAIGQLAALARTVRRKSQGAAKAYHYKNLSGGEKAAFDLLLDLHVKRRFLRMPFIASMNSMLISTRGFKAHWLGKWLRFYLMPASSG